MGARSCGPSRSACLRASIFLSRNSKSFRQNFVFREILQCCFAATLCRSEGRGGEGGPARTALRTLRANAECAYIGFHLYCFPFCHLLILWLCPISLHMKANLAFLFFCVPHSRAPVKNLRFRTPAFLNANTWNARTRERRNAATRSQERAPISDYIIGNSSTFLQLSHAIHFLYVCLNSGFFHHLLLAIRVWWAFNLIQCLHGNT